MQHLNSKLSKILAAPLGRISNRIQYRNIADCDKTIWVDQESIRYWYSGNRYDEVTYPGQIKGGDWSEKLITREERLKNRSGYIGLIERFKDGKPWCETRLFKEKHTALLKSRGKVKGIDNLEELEKYYEKRYDRLFEKVKKEGLLPADGENKDIDPIYIHIGSNGELIYTVDGNHRFYMALILGIRTMPVKVWMRHERWQEIREHILNRNGKDVDEQYRMFLTHPDIISELRCALKI